MKKLFILSSLFLFVNLIYSQASLSDISQGLSWRNIGPANQGGRIVDIEALDDDFTKLFVATGSGGVWKSINSGNTWTPIFDRYETASIGDIAIYQKKPDLLWVGTGEANNRNSVSWGNGIYKSTDGGQNFTQMGLENTHQIARVVTHPDNPEEVCVCAIGNLWGYTGDRGLFQTKDGGKSWEKLNNGLPDDGKTGCTDLVRDPKNPKILYAAFYHRLRQPWHFYSGGEQGGIYKSTNGGKSWEKLTNGLPGPTGRIGLAIYRKDPKILMALVEAEQTDNLAQPGSGVYRSEDGGKSWIYLNTYNNRPFYYSQIRINPSDDQRVYLLTTRFMVSEDGGKTLRNGSEDEEIHGDFHAMWLDPNNPERYYMGADKGLSITHDQGEHFFLLDNLPIAQFYRIGYDMREPYYVYGGLQDNGMYGMASFSRDARGILSDSNWKIHWGDGQYAMADPTDWRTVFTSAENGSLMRYDLLTHRINRISPNRANILNYDEVLAKSTGEKELSFRFNWSAPFVLSPHNSKSLYAGGNHLFRSDDQGISWNIISPDLSTNHSVKTQKGNSGGITPDNTGAETHCSMTTLSISPIDEKVIWTGMDDGNVQVTQNGGKSWDNVRTNVPNVPEGIWVSRLEASHFNPNAAYLTFDGHRSDHFGTWIFKTDDYGQNWKNIKGNLPTGEVIRVVREDLKNPDLLFIGTETGIWFSLNGGEEWARLGDRLPTVSVYDLKIHPRDHDLIAGTHGRSIWIMDDISSLQQLTPEVMSSSFYLFQQRSATLWENVSRGGQRGHFWYAGENPATIELTSSKARAQFRNQAMITYYSGTSANAQLELVISDLNGQKQRTIELETKPGINRYLWDLEFDAQPYTEAQLKAIDQMFKKYLAQSNSSTLRRTYTSFQNAPTSLEKRQIVDRLASGFYGSGIDESWLLPKAGPGTYRLTLRQGAQSQQQALEIREDPILKE